MSITTGVEMGRRRVRRAEPSSQASSVVKCSNTREESIREMDSSYFIILNQLMPLDVFLGGVGAKGNGKSGSGWVMN